MITLSCPHCNTELDSLVIENRNLKWFRTRELLMTGIIFLGWVYLIAAGPFSSTDSTNDTTLGDIILIFLYLPFTSIFIALAEICERMRLPVNFLFTCVVGLMLSYLFAKVFYIVSYEDKYFIFKNQERK